MLKTKIKKDEIMEDYKRVLYDEPGVLIYEEYDGRYGFEIHNKIFTNDIVEAVSYLMKFKKYDDDSFWNLAINKLSLIQVDPINSIYWLSGGEEFWTYNKWELNWGDHREYLANSFKTEIVSVAIGNDLRDVKNNILNKLNLDCFYEYFLEKKLIK